MKDQSPLFQRTIKLIQAIPRGKVLSYAQVANLISAPGCARHVSYILSSSSRKYELPWHRVLNSQGKISLPIHKNYYTQKNYLENEGVVFEYEKIDFKKFGWKPSKKEVVQILKGLPKHISLSAR